MERKYNSPEVQKFQVFSLVKEKPIETRSNQELGKKLTNSPNPPIHPITKAIPISDWNNPERNMLILLEIMRKYTANSADRESYEIYYEHSAKQVSPSHVLTASRLTLLSRSPRERDEQTQTTGVKYKARATIPNSRTSLPISSKSSFHHKPRMSIQSLESKVTLKSPPKSPPEPPPKSPTKSSTRLPPKSPTKSPTRSPPRSPAKSPPRSPARSPPRSPARSPPRTPTRSPPRSPARSPPRSPTRSPPRSPAKSPPRPPAKSPPKSPPKSPTENKFGAPETPARPDSPPIKARWEQTPMNQDFDEIPIKTAGKSAAYPPPEEWDGLSAFQSAPTPLNLDDVPIVTRGVVDFDDASPDKPAEVVRVECPTCGRKFAQPAAEKHFAICAKLKAKEVKPGNKKPARNAQAKEKVVALQQGPSIIICPTCTRKFNPEAASRHLPICAKITAKEARVKKDRIAYERKKTGASLKKDAKPSPHEEKVQCPTCNRTFNSDAAERHLPICAKITENDNFRRKNREGVKKPTAPPKTAPEPPPASGKPKENPTKKPNEAKPPPEAKAKTQEEPKNKDEKPGIRGMNLIGCQNCGRNFSKSAAERHMSKCSRFQETHEYQKNLATTEPTYGAQTSPDMCRMTTIPVVDPPTAVAAPPKVQPADKSTVQCPHCTRNFHPNAVLRHSPICQKNMESDVFRKRRLRDTKAAETKNAVRRKEKPAKR